MKAAHYIACDLGAESGRVILGTLTDGKLELEEIHRFPTGGVRLRGTLRWDILFIFAQLKEGLTRLAARNLPLSSLSVDSWGVDYVYFNASQPMLGLPYHYRDARTEQTYEAALERAGRDHIYAETGIQFMPINTIYQLLADAQGNGDIVGLADQFLNIADYFNYLFSGQAKNEISNASTTQLYNPVRRAWSESLIEKLGLPRRIFPELVASGTRLGPLEPDVRGETGLSGVEVVATCSHDTGAAVAAIPAGPGEDWAYLSSGTWSLIGLELPEPLINPAVLSHNFTNEAGYGDTTRFLRNIVGLWLLQESRRAWAREGQSLEYAGIMRLAEAAEPFRSLVDPNDPRFVSPAHMPEAIAAFCRETGQPEPTSPGQFARCILESLALSYRTALADLEQATGRTIARLHIVGGGSQSELLNQFAACATGRTVIAGPVEATAIGNLLIQAMALGHLDSLSDLRGIVRNSFPIREYQATDSAAWQQASERIF